MRTLAALAVLVPVAACQTAPPELTEAERAQIEAEVLEVMETFMDGLRQLDPDLAATTAHPELTTWCAGGQVVGQAGFRDAWANWMSRGESLEGSWVDTRVRVLSPELAVFSGTMEFTSHLTDGRVLHYPSSAMAFLLERTSEGWRSTVGGSSQGAPEPPEEG